MNSTIPLPSTFPITSEPSNPLLCPLLLPFLLRRSGRGETNHLPFLPLPTPPFPRFLPTVTGQDFLDGTGFAGSLVAGFLGTVRRRKRRTNEMGESASEEGKEGKRRKWSFEVGRTDLASMLRMITRQSSGTSLTTRGRSVGDPMGASSEDRGGVGAAGEKHRDGTGSA